MCSALSKDPNLSFIEVDENPWIEIEVHYAYAANGPNWSLVYRGKNPYREI